MREVRLIDANALKEEVNKKNVVGRFNTLLLIDNAPTINTEDCEGCPYCPNSNSGIPIGVE